eukprot:11708317-Prorocentrum_lima.AAC.1
MKGPRPGDQVLADPVPPGKFAETHTWVKGTVKGKIATVVDDLFTGWTQGKQHGMLEGLGGA